MGYSARKKMENSAHEEEKRVRLYSRLDYPYAFTPAQRKDKDDHLEVMQLARCCPKLPSFAL